MFMQFTQWQHKYMIVIVATYKHTTACAHSKREKRQLFRLNISYLNNSRRLECKKAIHTHLLFLFYAGSYRFMLAQHTGKITSAMVICKLMDRAEYKVIYYS